MSAPDKVHNIQSVQIQPRERHEARSAECRLSARNSISPQGSSRLAATSELNPATQVKGLAEVQFDAGDTSPTLGGGQGVPTKVPSITRRGCISEEPDEALCTKCRIPIEFGELDKACKLVCAPMESAGFDEGKPQVRFCEWAHGKPGAITPTGGGL